MKLDKPYWIIFLFFGALPLLLLAFFNFKPIWAYFIGYTCGLCTELFMSIIEEIRKGSW